MENMTSDIELLEHKFFLNITDKVAWLCDAKARVRQGDMVVVLYEGRLCASGRVLNRFPNINRKLQLEGLDERGKRCVARIWNRYPGRGWIVAVVEAVHTTF